MNPAPCPFCGFDEPEVTVYRGTHVQAFISLQPINRHHVLVVPDVHVTRFAQLEPAMREEVFAVAQRVHRGIAEVVRPDGITMVTEDDFTGVGLNEVAHWKLHLIPRFKNDTVRLDWGRTPDPGPAMRATYAATVRNAVQAGA
jgi:histidine triad (HIT) family protein